MELQEMIEIPENIRPAFASLKAYQTSCILGKLDDYQIGEMVRNHTIPPEAPLFRGTDSERYKLKVEELWWTFNLGKAASYADRNRSPLIVVGKMEDLFAFKKIDYRDQAVYIESEELYKGNFTVRPVMKTSRIGGISVRTIDLLLKN